MSNLSGAERSNYVQEMFERIAPRYDLMNRLMTGGQDIRWRNSVVEHAALKPGGWLLDLGTGTGDLAFTALKHQPELHVVAADFTLAMMRLGMQRFNEEPPSPRSLTWLGVDAANIPFPEASFDAVISGFLLRNVADLPAVLNEQQRVLKPGGHWVALDTSPPPNSLIAPFLRFHLHTIIPTLGRLISGQEEAYHYLPDTTERFLEPEKLADRLHEAGFEQVGFERRMLGTIAIHWGRKPGRING